jgi:RNA polymerase sigma-70 factor, ECF subfamily
LSETQETLTQTPTTFSRTLQAWRAGDAEAGDRLVALVWNELHRLARQMLRQERYAHSLNPTALINEAYLRLFGAEDRAAGKFVEIENRRHFFLIAARQMREILVDRARRAKARKRIRASELTPLDEAARLAVEDDLDLLALDEALTQLMRFDPRACRVVELHFFGGCTAEEVAELLDVSVATVRRDWRAARLWLLDRLRSRRHQTFTGST